MKAYEIKPGSGSGFADWEVRQGGVLLGLFYNEAECSEWIAQRESHRSSGDFVSREIAKLEAGGYDERRAA